MASWQRVVQWLYASYLTNVFDTNIRGCNSTLRQRQRVDIVTLSQRCDYLVIFGIPISIIYMMCVCRCVCSCMCMCMCMTSVILWNAIISLIALHNYDPPQLFASLLWYWDVILSDYNYIKSWSSFNYNSSRK